MTEVIRAPRGERVLNVVVFGPIVGGTGGVLVVVGFLPTSSARVLVVVLGLALVGLGTTVAVRAPSVAVHLSDDTLRYVGFLSSWSAPRDGIAVVMDDASVEWRDADGHRRRRQIGLLLQAYEDDGTKFAPLWRWRRQGLLRIRDWADARAF